MNPIRGRGLPVLETLVAMTVPLLQLVLAALVALTAMPLAALTPDACCMALSPEDAAAYEQAAQLFRGQHYAAAYGRFARLADRGHAPSAALALTMYLHGPQLFGGQWSATEHQQKAWNALAIHHARRRLPLPEPDAGD